jgi:hypothetical protein
MARGESAGSSVWGDKLFGRRGARLQPRPQHRRNPIRHEHRNQPLRLTSLTFPWHETGVPVPAIWDPRRPHLRKLGLPPWCDMASLVRVQLRPPAPRAIRSRSSVRGIRFRRPICCGNGGGGLAKPVGGVDYRGPAAAGCSRFGRTRASHEWVWPSSSVSSATRKRAFAVWSGCAGRMVSVARAAASARDVARADACGCSGPAGDRPRSPRAGC